MTYKQVPAVLFQEEAKRMITSYEEGAREDLSVRDLKVLLGTVRRSRKQSNFLS